MLVPEKRCSRYLGHSSYQQPLKRIWEHRAGETSPQMTSIATRQYGLGSVATTVLAFVLLANSYRIDNRERAAQREAEEHGVVASAVIEAVDLESEQRRTRVLVIVRGVAQIATVFSDRPFTRGTTVRVAWAPDDPARIYIVGTHPWSWWVVQRPLFGTIAGISLLVGLIALMLDWILADGQLLPTDDDP